MSLNWVDIVLLFIFLLGLFVARKNEFKVEVYYFFGTIFTTFIALHYFSGFSLYLNRNFMVPDSMEESLAFCLLAGLTYSLFMVSEGGWNSLLSLSVPSFVNKWGALALCVFRNLLFSGLLYMVLLMVGDGALTVDVKSSVTSPFFKRVSVVTYSTIFDVIVKPLNSHEKFNDRVYQIVNKPWIKQKRPRE